MKQLQGGPLELNWILNFLSISKSRQPVTFHFWHEVVRSTWVSLVDDESSPMVIKIIVTNLQLPLTILQVTYTRNYGPQPTTWEHTWKKLENTGSAQWILDESDNSTLARPGCYKHILLLLYTKLPAAVLQPSHHYFWWLS